MKPGRNDPCPCGSGKSIRIAALSATPGRDQDATCSRAARPRPETRSPGPALFLKRACPGRLA